MSYIIYKLKFPNGIHIGGVKGIGLESTSLSMNSDTLYSAIYYEYMRLYNDEKLIKSTKNGDFLISDLFPFKGDRLYIPKPFVSIEREKEKQYTKTTIDRKKVKSLNYIPLKQIKEYFSFLRTGDNFPQVDDEFGNKQLDTKNNISYRGEDTQIYNIESFKFNEKSGLYFIVKLPENWKDKFDNLIDSLSHTGIGGKKSSGLGKFEKKEILVLEDKIRNNIQSDHEYLNKYIHTENINKYLLLSSYLPSTEDIEKLKQENNWYNLIKRSGFVNSPYYSNQPQKRKQVYMLSSGSILSFKPEGKIIDLNLHGNHSIYRMGKPIVMGVDLWEK